MLQINVAIASVQPHALDQATHIKWVWFPTAKIYC